MTVIGYKGTPEERLADWHAMLHYRDCVKTFTHPEDEWEKEKLVKDAKNLNRHIEKYVDAA